MQFCSPFLLLFLALSTSYVSSLIQQNLMFMVRSEIISLRSERDKLALEANFARERLESFMKEFEHQVIFLLESFAKYFSLAVVHFYVFFLVFCVDVAWFD